MKSKQLKNALNSPFWEVYFHMTYVCPVTPLAFVLGSIIEKVQMMTPLIAFIFHQSPWNSIYSAVLYLIVSPVAITVA